MAKGKGTKSLLQLDIQVRKHIELSSYRVTTMNQI